MSETIFAGRDWISADVSFAMQATELPPMVNRLNDQLHRLKLPKPNRIALIGIGASHAAAAGAVYQMRANGLDALRFLPSELPAGLSGLEGLAVLISQSGRSAEIVDLARQSGQAAILALTNYAPSPLASLATDGLNLGNLPDSSVSLVSFTGTMLALAMLADHWKGESRVAYWKDMIAEALSWVEAHDADLKDLAALLAVSPSVDIVAPAPLMSVAEETSLMLREGPRLFATAMETRQYLHGPMDAAGAGAHLVLGGKREALLIDQLGERTKNRIFVTGAGDTDNAQGATKLVLPVSLEEPLSFAIAATFVTQKLTLHAAALRGIDINEAAFQRLDTKTNSLKKS